MRQAIFLDRDGTINIEKNYIYRIEDWEWIPEALEAIRMFNRMNYLVIIVTNQAGVARGYYSKEDVEHLHEFVRESAKKYGADIDEFYFCPHHPNFGESVECFCRKPKPGLILQAKKDFGIELSESFVIGDKLTDLQAGILAGVKPILVLTGYGEKELVKAQKKYFEVAENLIEACKIIETYRGRLK